MKRISLFAYLWITLIGLHLPSQVDASIDEVSANLKTIRYAPLPMTNPALNLAKSQLLTQYLQSSLNIHIVPKLYDNYEDILTAFQTGEVELIELGPLVYFTLKSQTDHATPLVSVKHHPDEEHYQCVLATPIDGIQNIKSPPKDYQVALTQPLSTCGWLMTDRMLEKQGIDLENLPTRYLGSHEAVAMALIRKEYALGGLARFIAERYANLGLNILEVSEPLPQFLLVANNARLSPKETIRIQKALLAYQATDPSMDVYGFNPFSEKLFDHFQSFLAQKPMLNTEVVSQ